LRSPAGRALGPGVLLVLVFIASILASESFRAVSAIRHLYLVPTVWAALTLGATGGGLTGLIAGLLQAPFILPAVEWMGLGGESIDGLVVLLIPVAFGWVLGGLVDQSRDRASRLHAVLNVQRSLSLELPLERRLDLAAEGVRAALRANAVALVVGGTAGRRIVASAPSGLGFVENSAVAWVLREGDPLLAGDVSRDARFARHIMPGPTPIRGFVIPLDSGSGCFGALAVEQRAGLRPTRHAAAREMALHLALAVENARLALRQRSFTEELEDKVAAATNRLRELDRAKTEFVSVVAHELRTPLTALQGFTEILLARQVPPERAVRFLGHLHSEAERLGRIVSELLDLSRIETGAAVELNRDEVDLAEALERNVDLFAAQHPSHHFEWRASVPRVPADRDALDRILKNLISNAVKYSPGGGRVIVIAESSDDRPGMVEITVEDDGVGIPESQLSRIFDKYTRVPNPATATTRGLGLGLALVRALAEAQAGCVQVESMPGKGSKFRVFLPGQSAFLVNFPNSSA